MKQNNVAIAFPRAIPNEFTAWQRLAIEMRQQLSDAFIEQLSRLLSLDNSPIHLKAIIESLEVLGAAPADVRREVLSSPEACAWRSLVDGLARIMSGEVALPTVAQAWTRLSGNPPNDATYLSQFLWSFADEARRFTEDSTKGKDCAPVVYDLQSHVSNRIGSPSAYPLLSVIVPSESINMAEREEVLTAAFDLLNDWSSTFANTSLTAIRLILSWPKPCETWHPHQIVEQHYPSGSVGFLPGVCWIASGRSPLWTAEALVHETCHQILHVIENTVPLVADEHGRAHSPWQPQPRSFRGVLHGFFAFGHAFIFLRHSSGLSNIPPGQRDYAHRRTHLLQAQLRIAREELVQSALTEEGLELVTKMSAALELDQGSELPFVEAVVQARRQLQRRGTPEPRDNSRLVTELLMWVDQRIAATNVCPFATPSLDQEGTRVVILSGHKLADVLFDISDLVQAFIAPNPPRISDCLIVALPDLDCQELVKLNAISPQDLLSISRMRDGDAVKLNLKTRVFDPNDPESYAPPVPLWLLRAPTPDGR